MKRGRVFISVEQGDTKEKLAAATLVAARLTSQGHLDFASVFVSAETSGCPIAIRVEYAAKPQVLNLTGGKTWRITTFWSLPEIDPLDIDQITRSHGFADAAAEYGRVCLRMGDCEYGISGC